jgi:hypothetical protein
MRYISTEDLRNFWPSYRQWSQYHITVCQANTARQAVIWLTQIFWVWKSRFQIPSWKSIALNLIVALSINTFSNVTTTDVIYYKLQKSQRSDQYSVHKINPEIHFMCELHVRVKLFTTACSLCNADSYFFPNQNNPCSCSFLNACTTVQQYIGTNVRLSKEKTMKEKWGNLVLVYYQILSVRLLETFCPARSLNMKFGTRSEKKCALFKTMSITVGCL